MNLDVAAIAATFTYWNGSITTANGTVNGGTGTWNNGTTNWTDAPGPRAARGRAARSAQFTGAAGTVTLGGKHHRGGDSIPRRVGRLPDRGRTRDHPDD
ncbi:MAG: hypothetical protein WDN28_31465 [Chthoniobacter sp.]